MGLSIEFLIIVFSILVVISIIIIANIIGMKKLEKNNNDLEKESEEYKNNNKKIQKRFKLIMCIIYIIEIIFLTFNYFFCTCMCGYREFKMLPLSIFIILQLIVDFKFFRLNKEKEHKVNYLIKYILVSIISFVIIVVLSKNDMEKLHRAVLE